MLGQFGYVGFIRNYELESRDNGSVKAGTRGSWGRQHWRVTSGSRISGQREKGQIASVLWWSVPLCFAVFLLAIWLLAKGSKGVDISGALSLPVSLLSLLASLVFYILTERGKSNGERKASSAAKSHQGHWARTLGMIATALILGIGAPVIYWQVIHKPDLPVTDMVKLTGGQAMADGSQARLDVPGAPPSRRNIAITLRLDNPAGLGDCIQPAQLKVIPVLDGSMRKPVNALSGSETRLSLNGATHAAAIDVILTEPDPACRVNLNVSAVVLYN